MALCTWHLALTFPLSLSLSVLVCACSNLYVNPQSHGYNALKGNKKLFVSILGPKSIFGEVEVLAQRTMGATVVAATTTEIYTLEAQILSEKIPKLIIDQLQMEAEMKQTFQNERIHALMSKQHKQGPYQRRASLPLLSSGGGKGEKLTPGRDRRGQAGAKPARAARRGTSFIKAGTISRLAEPKTPIGHDGVDCTRDSYEQAVLCVREEAYSRKARFRDLNRLKYATVPSERVVRGFVDFHVATEKKLLLDSLHRPGVS